MSMMPEGSSVDKLTTQNVSTFSTWQPCNFNLPYDVTESSLLFTVMSSQNLPNPFLGLLDTFIPMGDQELGR